MELANQKISPHEVKHTMKGELKMSPFELSKVDIIVPFHGQYQKVTRLIESIYRSTRPPFKLTLVDDGSINSGYLTDSLDQPGRSFGSVLENTNINCVRNDKQLGFASALKKGFDETNFPWVVFMDSDCYVDNVNWLNLLGESMMELKNHGVKMISARYPNSGSDLKHLSTPARPMKDVNDIILQKGEHLPLTCVMFHRDLFKRIGGFLKEYPFGWYEDQELAYRMNHYNFKQAICHKSWIHHDGMSTIKECWDRTPEIRDIMIKNEELCIKDINALQK